MNNTSTNYVRVGIVAIFAIIIGVVTLVADERGENPPVVSTDYPLNDQNVVDNSNEVATTTGATQIGEHDYILPDGRGFYSNPSYDISFAYPKSWVVTEFDDPRSPGFTVKPHSTITGEYFYVSVYTRDQEELVRMFDWFDWYGGNGYDVDTDYGVYAWLNPEPSEYDYLVGAGLEILTPETRTSIRVPKGQSIVEVLTTILETARIQGFQIGSKSPSGFLEYLNKIFMEETITPLAGNPCTRCNETDPYPNTYSCNICTFGNCTWKCEQVRAGENFNFLSMNNQNAYRWMTLEQEVPDRSGAPRYPTGGTIPKIGAVIVFKNTISNEGPTSGNGHVATVTAVNSSGSVTMIEQNCTRSCTVSTTRTVSSLITHRAGYIYSGTSAPHPTPKEISGVIGEQTIIDDYSLTSNVYNFGTYGPGAKMGSTLNRGERMWGTEATGLNGCCHFTYSKSAVYRSLPENSGIWAYRVPTAGTYEIQAWIPNTDKSGATNLSYQVLGIASVPINQQTNRGRFVKLVNPNRTDGNWNYPMGGTSEIIVGDTYVKSTDPRATNSVGGQFISMDAIRFKRVS